MNLLCESCEYYLLIQLWDIWFLNFLDLLDLDTSRCRAQYDEVVAFLIRGLLRQISDSPCNEGLFALLIRDSAITIRRICERSEATIELMAVWLCTAFSPLQGNKTWSLLTKQGI